MSLGLLVLRVVVGLLFFGHGAQKLFGWYGGHGLAGTGAFFEQMGFPQGKRQAFTAGLFEAAGGLLLALGLFTPFAAAALIAVMTVAPLLSLSPAKPPAKISKVPASILALTSSAFFFAASVTIGPYGDILT